ALRLLDVDADGFLVVEERERPRLRRAVAHVGDITKARGNAIPLRDDELLELLRILEPPLEADRSLVHRTRDAPDRRSKILQLKRLHDLTDTHSGARHARRIELHGELALH